MTTKEKLNSFEERLQIIEAMLKLQGTYYADDVSEEDLVASDKDYDEYRKNPSIAVPFEQVLAENSMTND
jgi:hypothetical protein